jgi:hypothetical protein
MERPRSGTERTPCCRRAHRPQRADHATSRIGHETAPNRLSRLLPHRGFHLGAEGLSRVEPEVRIHLPPPASRPHPAADAERHAGNTSRGSSESRRAAIGVEPTRSQNMTVSWWHSALSVRCGVVAACGGGATVSTISLPQPPQNFAIASFSRPHAGRGTARAEAH